MSTNKSEISQKLNSMFKEVLKYNKYNTTEEKLINLMKDLTQTIKTLDATESKDLIKDEYKKIFCINILPLFFDSNKNIQDNVITMSEIFLSKTDITTVHKLPEWPSIKSKIVNTYTKRISEMQEENENWYKIWCQLTLVLDKEMVIKHVINPFLIIVENGFRSNIFKLRSEAFICWKLIIKLMYDNDQMSTMKCIKLICIPLKSSQARTLETAVNKFKAWWYFLCKLGPERIENFLSLTLDSFLKFCFGVTLNQLRLLENININRKLYFYPVVKEMAIECFAIMLMDNNETNTTYNELCNSLKEKGLEVPTLSPSETLISLTILLKIPKLVLNAAFDSTIMILKNNHGKKSTFKIIWKSLYDKIFKLNNYEIYTELYDQLEEFLNCEYVDDDVKQICLNNLIDLIVFQNQFPIKFDKIIKNEKNDDDYEDEKQKQKKLKRFHKPKIYYIVDNIWIFTKLLLKHIHFLKYDEKFDTLFRSLLNIANCKNLNDDEHWLLHKYFIDFIMKNETDTVTDLTNDSDDDGNDDNDSGDNRENVQNVKNEDEQTDDDDDDDNNNNNVKCILNLIVWKYLTLNIIDYLNKSLNIVRFGQNSNNIDLFNDWILWPLNLLSTYDDKNNTTTLNLFNNENIDNFIDEFLTVWSNLLILYSNKISDSILKRICIGINLNLQLNENKNITKISDIVCKFISCFESNKFDKKSDSSSFKSIKLFDLIKSILKNNVICLENKMKIIASFNASYIKSLNDNQMYDIFPEMKDLISVILRLHLKKIDTVDTDTEKLMTLLKSFQKETQRLIHDKLKTNKKLLKEFKEITLNRNNKNTKDEFIAIQTVWSYNPEKLTEHQKEKMKEKRIDIPALYNELSQSQDTNSNTNSIKPWTPNKIVINKGKYSVAETIIPSQLNSENLTDKHNQISHSEALNEKEIIQCEEEQIENENFKIQRKSEKSTSSNCADDTDRNKTVSTEHRTELNSESVLKTQRSPIKPKLNKNTSITKTATTNVTSGTTSTTKKEVERHLSVYKDTENQMNENNKNDSPEKQPNDEIGNKDILDKINIKVDDEGKRQKIMRQLKTIQIDTSEGFTVVEQKLRRRQSTTTPVPISPDDTNRGEKTGKRGRKRVRLSKNPSDDIKNIPKTATTTTTTTLPNTVETTSTIATPTTNTTTTTTTPKSLSKPARKSLQFDGNIKNDVLNNGDSGINESNTKDNEKEKAENDSSNEEVIGSSQQCESIFAKRFIIRKSMTPAATNETNRVSSPSKNKSNHTKETTVENPTVPDDLNGARIPTKTASESRDAASVETIKSGVQITPLLPSLSAINQTEIENFHDNRESMAVLLDTQQNELFSSSAWSKSKAMSDELQPNKVSEMDTEPFNVSLINNLPNNGNDSNTIIKNPLGGEVHILSTSNTSQQKCTENSTNTTINTMTIENKICDAETQPNTENFDSSNENSPKTPNKHNHEQEHEQEQEQEQEQYMEIDSEPSNLSPMLNERSASLSKSGAQLSKSILSSPECVNAKEKTTEFLNDTLNISPISVDMDRSNHENEKNALTNASTTSTNLTSNTNGIVKCTSPTNRKSTLKSNTETNLSPPNRKTINTVCSPAIKPKPIAQLMGRGAQFIDMIRRKNSESTPKQQLVNTLTSLSASTSTSEEKSATSNEKHDEHTSDEQQQHENTTTVCPPSASLANNVLQTPINHKNLLVFSKTLPSPCASPTNSILKRKLCRDNFDETVETPITKRKRVSFHDPPVSVTKEYVKHSEENRRSPLLPLASTPKHSPKSIEKLHFTRYLPIENTSTPQNMKKFKRISRTDSIEGIAEFVNKCKRKCHNNDQQQSSTSSAALAMDLANNENENVNVNENESVNVNNEKQVAVTSPAHPSTSNNETVVIPKNHFKNDSKTVIENSVEMESLRWETVDHNSITTNNTNTNVTNIVTETIATTVPIASTSTSACITEATTTVPIASTSGTNTNNATAVNNNNIIAINDDDDEDEDDENSLPPSPSLYFSDEQSMFKYLTKNYKIDTIIEKYLNSSEQFDSKSLIINLIKKISTYMTKDKKLKLYIFDLLSEKYPTEFLEHAIQENLSSTVCSKLNTDTIIKFITDKSKSDSSTRKSLLDSIIINLFDSKESDLQDLLKQIINKKKLSSDQILNCMRILINSNNNCNEEENGNDDNDDD